MRDADRRALLATCVAAAATAAKLIRERAESHTSITWEEKGRADFVSDVDRGAEQLIVSIVAERHPDARVLGEEYSPGLEHGSGVLFVVDPLDGTTNFLHGFPWYAVSIAALVDGTLEAGAVLNVPTGELFTATRGGGARRNGQPIAVSKIEDPIRALIGTGMPFKSAEGVETYLTMLSAVMRGTAGIRRPGSASLDLADIACGRFDAFWEIRLAPWDIAAGLLLVREAGGVVTDLDGAPAQVRHTGLIAANPAMHDWMMQTLAAARA